MRGLICGVCFVLSAVNGMALPVIYDSGNTVPIEPYLSKRVQKQPVSPEQSLPIRLPITTPSLSVGVVTKTEKSLPHLQPPLFLIGADKRSQQWLQLHRDRLLSLGAIGLLVHVKSMADIENIAALGQGLRIVPASAEGFARKLGLTHYPVLISAQGWEQ